MSARTRCPWCGDDPLYQHYHDTEWGVPLYDDKKLFEFLLLEGAQAGLSWITILRKRENYRHAFDQFNPEKIARYTEKKQEKLLQNTGIVRNKLKIKAFSKNAQAYLAIVDRGQTFADYLWQFVDGEVIQNQWQTMKEVPSVTTEAEQMSKQLKKEGFTFVGPTICYAFMQATGMVNDHLVSCFRHHDLSG
ncbi:MAG: DNA-3-methyladenine glycosylase I [Cellvibrionaceae bacterium]|nr:DNA-3-methyladenine glycosylase I [Cellvibrionaceae bacterium]